MSDEAESRNIKDVESDYNELEREIHRPFTSPDEAAILIGNIMARTFLVAVQRWTRIAVNVKDRPGHTGFWNAYRDIVEGGFKTIAALKVAYSWEEALRLLKEAKLRIKQLLIDKQISPDEAKQAEEQLIELEAKMRDASKSS